jgi:hypothetical protein
MAERLVDVEKQGSKILHTFPVTISAPAEEEAFKEKALEAAGNAKLVPNAGFDDSASKQERDLDADRPRGLDDRQILHLSGLRRQPAHKPVSEL